MPDEAFRANMLNEAWVAVTAPSVGSRAGMPGAARGAAGVLETSRDMKKALKC